MNMMPTIKGKFYVEGWDVMVEEHPTRAAVLQALVNLEIDSIIGNGPAPTQAVIAKEVSEKGLQTETKHIDIKFSPGSVKEVNRHINDHLIPDGYVVSRDDPQGSGKRRAAGWKSVIVTDVFRKQFGY